MSQAIRLLIADDHPVVRDGLRGIFEASGEFEVAGEAANGREAVDRAAALRPDVVLMDLRMPVLDGVSAIRLLAEKGVSARVLVLTTYDTDTDVVPAIEAGATGYLLKDSPPDELLRQHLDRADPVQHRHAQVHQHHVGLERGGAVDRLTAVRRLPRDLELTAGFEDAAQPVAHYRVIVGDQQPDGLAHFDSPALVACGDGSAVSACGDGPSGMAGRLADTAVPAPGSDSISSCPASRLTRCRIAIRPKPPAAGTSPARCPLRSATANPAPSSRTSRLTTSSI